MLAVALWVFAAPPSLLAPPRFGWDSIGNMSFAHITKEGDFNATDLDFLSRFSVVQFDKGQFRQSMPHATQEDRFIAAAKAVKAKDAGIKTLMYFNGLINFPEFQRLINATDADPSLLLRNTTGGIVNTLGQYTTFDHRNPKMRELFVDDALYGVRSGAFDGVFVDRANWADRAELSKITRGGWDEQTRVQMIPAQTQLFVDLSKALGEHRIVLAKETGGGAPFKDGAVANAMMVTDTFCSGYTNGATPASVYDASQCLADIQAVQATAERGQMSQSHSIGPVDDSVTRHFTMACFLVAAGNYSYFAHADWHQSWTLDGLRWWPELDYPLGAPLAKANRTGWVFSREFESGTTVRVDVKERSAQIAWAK